MDWWTWLYLNEVRPAPVYGSHSLVVNSSSADDLLGFRSVGGAPLGQPPLPRVGHLDAVRDWCVFPSLAYPARCRVMLTHRCRSS
jgi:hypothetical protein